MGALDALTRFVPDLSGFAFVSMYHLQLRQLRQTELHVTVVSICIPCTCISFRGLRSDCFRGLGSDSILM